MYTPSHYEETRPEALHDVLVKHPLGVLVTCGSQGLDANHLPFELDAAAGILRAHVARKNPVWQQVAQGDEVLVVFRADEAYISPSWYPTKHETGRQVPTWNYRVVHVHGRITVHDDEKYVRGVVARLTRRHEADQPVPWKMGDAPAAYIDEELKAIVGIEIAVTRMVGKFKLSQMEETRDRVGAGEALVRLGEPALGHAMLDAKSFL
jgi:transcriptional regulator